MIPLSIPEIEFMLATLPLTDDLRHLLNDLKSRSDKVVSDDVADALRDLCADRLDTHGFDKDYEPTSEGKMLESLIDKLFID